MNFRKKLTIFITAVMAVMSFPVNTIASSEVKGDANGDGELSIRDAAYIAGALSRGQTIDLIADYNGDGKVNIRDASAIAAALTVPFTSYAKEILRLVNEERARVGVSPLVLNVSLVNAANVRAEEIKESFSHTRPDNTSFSTVFNDLNISYYCCGENIAAGLSDAEVVVEQWINSPTHYKNIVNENFTQLGVGYYYNENSTYKHHWVQLFKCD